MKGTTVRAVGRLLSVLVALCPAALLAQSPSPPSSLDSDTSTAEVASGATDSAAADARGEPASESPADYQTLSLRGRMVWMAEALERRYGIKSVPEAADRLLAIETRDGELYPLVEDLRGRAFRLDRRLRELPDCELLVRRYTGSPLVQVIRVYSHEEGRKYELDYWCEICAIAMFELKPCDCCQGDIELRKRPVE